MPVFVYRAKDGPVRTVESELVADSRAAALAELDARGLIPLSVQEKESGRGHRWAVPARRVRGRDVTVFTRQLASLIRSGVPILRALSTIEGQTENPRLRRVVGQLRGTVRDGQLLSEALAGHRALFPDLYIAMVRAGESGGVLDTVLLRLAEAREQEEETRRKVQAAVAYPALTVGVGLLTVFVLLSFFLPRILALFKSYARLPLPTRILIGISDFLGSYWYWLVLILGLLFAIWRRVVAHERGRLLLHGLQLRLPLFGRFLLASEVARFARTFALLLGSGLAIDRALKLAADSFRNCVLRDEIERVRRDTVQQGATFSDGLRKAAHFPPFAANMSAVGEEGGRLDESLTEIASFYEREVDQQTRLALSLLEPILILAVGGMVGFIVAAMLLPVFELGTAL